MARQNTADIENARDYTNINKLSLDTGEKARIVLIEGGSWIVENYHELRNKAKPTKAESDAGAQSAKEDFYGNFLCKGDPAIIKAGDKDIDRCPFCAAVAGSGGRVLPAKRGFATNIIRYGTPKFDHNITQPPQVALLAWVHRDERKIKTIKDLEASWGDLRTRDLTLTNENVFQNYTIQPTPEAAYLQDANLHALVNQTFEINKYADEVLTDAIGRSVDAEAAERHIRTVLAAGAAAAAPAGYVPQAAPVAVPPQLAAQAAGVPLTAPGLPALPPQQAPAPAGYAPPGLPAMPQQAAPAPAGLPALPQAAPAPGLPALPPQQAAPPTLAPVPQAAPPLNVAGLVPQAAPAAPVEQAALPAIPPAAPVAEAPPAPAIPAIPALPPLAGQAG